MRRPSGKFASAIAEFDRRVAEVFWRSPEVVQARIALRNARLHLKNAPTEDAVLAARSGVEKALEVLAWTARLSRYEAWLAALGDLTKTDDQIAIS